MSFKQSSYGSRRALQLSFRKTQHILGRTALTLAPEEPPHAVPSSAPVSLTYQSPDGLTLAAKEWPVPQSAQEDEKVTVLCLPGLSRNTRDFNEIAAFLQGQGHRVIALDYRGRGDSDWDPEWQNYALPVEEKDIDAAIKAFKLDRFAILGTSRGGLHALAMAHRYPPDRLAAVIFNDIGPHIEMRAIHRIAATLGRNMSYASLDEVAGSLRHMLGMQFPVFSADDWLKMAGQVASEKDGKVVLDYDPALGHQFASLDDGAPVPDLWPLYEFLKDRPVMVIRGEKSDLLGEDTAQRMVDSHLNAVLHTVEGQGHAPVLWDSETHERIGEFLSKV
jgi:pimeloyl-ACP methyl ester carboxylesterase